MNWWLLRIALALALVFGLAGLSANAQEAGPEGSLEVFTWWTTGGEAAGLKELFNLYEERFPAVGIIHTAVAGGAGEAAKAVLVTRMLGGNPPDSFQVHMGGELIETWVVTDFMEPLDELYRQEGWEEVFPQGVLDLLSYEGSYYSVPSNIHRSNVLWYNRPIFEQYGLEPPATFEEFFEIAELLEAEGIIPHALGDTGIWASTHLLETVLMGVLGPEAYRGLWTGATDWRSPEVTEALETFSRMLDYVNPDHSARSWDLANNLLIEGRAAMYIHGDWVNADYMAKDFEDYGFAPAPGNVGLYGALSDTFGLPRDAQNPTATIEWLRLVGSKVGQEAFNPLKGSICARIDCDPEPFNPYLRWTMEQWEQDEIVPSLAHGAAAPEAWVTDIHDVVSVFVSDRDVARAQEGLARTCVDAGVCEQ